MIKLEFNDFEHKYIQLANYIKQCIERGQIEDGEKLPTIRELSESLNVNKITVIKAYKKLEEEGHAISKMGSGTFAKRKDFTRIFKKHYSETFKKLDKKDLDKVIDFTGETTSVDLFPIEEFKSIINEVLNRDGAEALIYQDHLGYENLRETIKNKFWDNKVQLDNILIVSGAQQGIDLIGKTLINANDYVVVEKPTYSGALSVFKGRRANILEVEMEDDGVNLESLEKILKRNNVKAFYTMSYFQNPSGITLSTQKKRKLVQLAEKYDFYVVEDDYLSELIYDESIEYSPIKTLDKKQRIIYIKSFSKVFLPGIRLGYMIVPEKLKNSIQLAKINTDISTSSLMQRVLQLYIEREYWAKSADNLKSVYKQRYECIVTSIREVLGDKVSFVLSGGALHLFLKIKNDDMDSIRLYKLLKKKNVFITPGVMFFLNGKDGLKYFRIGFSEVDCAKIKEGISIIGEYL
ncbi:PLP-dependent aminotransferase family protein [Inconstantimicrobium mannanitabidum]|uniref:GntR family transcriptional regulator n=1 Tax=Inconstantimicrobium mannanitabidum TaxID=1604901 RepID=A0ACB5RAD4_9CLOT|nr:PLP-dependent aminotransferase family protein [Clostridium sp. TW13]GKX66005.1 GntR family transcriptional regulator [Clostridium sp. TW13]